MGQSNEGPTAGSVCRTLIICKSVHHQNTAAIARALATVLHAEVRAPEHVSIDEISNYDIIGFGSGIYFGQFHSALRHWARQLPDEPRSLRRAILFSTSGLSWLWRIWHWPFRRLLRRKGFAVIGEFHCRGFDTVGPLWLLGGLNRHHPDARDLAQATEFARQMNLARPDLARVGTE
ncbi:MAG: flavodoxin family protein [Planctomycetes bacterium]|nr:flavodoxin family protein [Planctomycetota bacterium]